MIVSSWVGVIIIIITIIILSLIVWTLSVNRNNLAIKSCNVNDDCPPGFFCGQSSKTCILQGTCEISHDCPGNDYCVNERCVDCVNSTQCPLGSTCINNRCSVIICQSQADCAQGTFCNQGTTGETGTCLPMTCQSNQDCQEMTGVTGMTMMICHQGFCVEAGITCSSSQECYGGTLICINSTCLECRDSTDCLFGQTCMNNLCITTNPMSDDSCHNCSSDSSY